MNYSRTGNQSLSIRQPGSIISRPYTQTSQRFSNNQPIIMGSQPHFSTFNGSVAGTSQPEIQTSKHVRFDSMRSDHPPGTQVSYSNFIPPGAIPASEYQSGIQQGSIARYSGNLNHQSINPRQTDISIGGPFNNINQSYHQSYFQEPPMQQPQTAYHQQHHSTIITQPIQPQYNSISHVVPVPVVGASQMRNTALRNSRMSNPLYMVDNQYIQRPPNLSYIDQGTSTCPVWIWGLLGTLALLGIILTLVFVGKKDPGAYKITQVQTPAQPETNGSTPLIDTTKTQQKQPSVENSNTSTVINQTAVVTPPPVVLNQSLPTINPDANVSFVPAPIPDSQKTDDQVYRQQLIKQQNSTIVNQQMELDSLKNQLIALRSQNQLASRMPPVINPLTPTINPLLTNSNPTRLDGVISNPANITTQPNSTKALDITQCQAGYYPYGGICFPCKTGYWNGTNCIQNKLEEKAPQINTTLSSNVSSNQSQSSGSNKGDAEPQTSCKEGYFLKNGRCITCPQGSTWNGNNCIKKVKVSAEEQGQNSKQNICPQGKFLLNGQCSSCPEGLFWDGKGCFEKPLKRKHIKNDD